MAAESGSPSLVNAPAVQTHSILVSGLTIIRNGVRLDYPFVEAIRSALPICDEYIVVLGDCEDGTREAIESLREPKIRIVDTHWSKLVTPQECLLAQQTNIGLNLARGQWCLAMQGAEVLHERDLPHLRALMETHVNDPRVEAMLFERLAFWADYEHVLAVYPWLFKYTPRIVRCGIGVHSIRDAMSFAVFDRWSTCGRYPRCIDTGAYIYRYSDVRDLEILERKFRESAHGNPAWRIDSMHYFSRIPREFIRRHLGGHPEVMSGRIQKFPRQYRLDDPRCRRTITAREWVRILETKLYHMAGFPRWRNSRFRLIGNLVAKPDRPR